MKTEACISPTELWAAQRLGIETGQLDQKELENYQLSQFRRTVEYAMANSRFYKEHFAGLDPNTIRTMDSIRALPFTSESDLSGNEHLFQCVSPGRVSRIVTVPTTGTSGHKKRLAFSENDQKNALEFIYTGFIDICKGAGRMLVMMSGGSEGSIGDSVAKAMSALGIETLVYGPVVDIEEAYRCILDFKPNVIVGIPYHMAALARFGEGFGNPEKEHIQSVLLSADDVPDSICQRLGTLWGCSTYRHYGMTEMCIAGAVECPCGFGYHLRGCDILFEIVDVDEDGFGEVVISTLNREAMPLIRYRTGDIARFTDEPCKCGGKLRRIETIRGRKNSSAYIQGKRLFISDISNAVFSAHTSIDFECALDQGALKLKVFTLPGDKADEAAILSALGLSAEIVCAERTAFSEAYNLKKALVRGNIL